MAKSIRPWLAGLATALMLLTAAPALAADPATAQPSYKGAQYVQVMLGQPDVEQGIRLIDGQPDGLTQPSTEFGGRQSLPNQIGQERFFYFDLADTYFRAGQNKVQMTVTYRDIGLTPIYLEYDAFDPFRPQSRAPEVTRKRVTVAARSNSEGSKTAFLSLDDARFDGGQPGGADFRIFSTDDLVISNVSVMLVSHADAPKPIRVVVDGKAVAFDPNDVQPFVHAQTGRTLVPLRALLTAIGVRSENIIWQEATRTVEVKKGDKTIALTIDDVTVKINGWAQAEKLDQPATIVAGRMVVPLRFIATQFGLKVDWNEQTRTATLTTLVQDPVNTPPNPNQPPTPPQTKP